jgi:hypothetical protein
MQDKGCQQETRVLTKEAMLVSHVLVPWQSGTMVTSEIWPAAHAYSRQQAALEAMSCVSAYRASVGCRLLTTTEVHNIADAAGLQQ